MLALSPVSPTPVDLLTQVKDQNKCARSGDWGQDLHGIANNKHNNNFSNALTSSTTALPMLPRAAAMPALVCSLPSCLSSLASCCMCVCVCVCGVHSNHEPTLNCMLNISVSVS